MLSKYPKHNLDPLFIHLIRPKLISNDSYYKSHIKELIERYINNECLSYATKAEISVFIHTTSIKVSLPSASAFMAMIELFDYILPKED